MYREGVLFYGSAIVVGVMIAMAIIALFTAYLERNTNAIKGPCQCQCSAPS